MALLVRLDINNAHRAASIKIVRVEAHKKLKHHFWYTYQAADDEPHLYIGKVLHNYNHGVFALTQKVTKAIVAQQRVRREVKA